LRALRFPPIAGNGIAGAGEPFLVAPELFQRFVAKNFVLLRAGRMSYSLRSRTGVLEANYTGADESMFGYEAAQQLDLYRQISEAGKPDPSSYESDKENGYAFLNRWTLADGSGRDAWWCYRNVGIELGGSDLLVRGAIALTPQNSSDGGLVFDWDRSSFKQNLLGMADLLSARHALCDTRNAV